eukprot:scaffold2300_cov138-Isochrysis_galbana.AAC.2
MRVRWACWGGVLCSVHYCAYAGGWEGGVPDPRLASALGSLISSPSLVSVSVSSFGDPSSLSAAFRVSACLMNEPLQSTRTSSLTFTRAAVFALLLLSGGSPYGSQATRSCYSPRRFSSILEAQLPLPVHAVRVLRKRAGLHWPPPPAESKPCLCHSHKLCLCLSRDLSCWWPGLWRAEAVWAYAHVTLYTLPATARRPIMRVVYSCASFIFCNTRVRDAEKTGQAHMAARRAT